MSYTCHSIFTEIRPIAPLGLSDRILGAIKSEQISQAQSRARFAAWSAGAWFIMFLTSVTYVGKSLLASEFWQILSLLFTDLSLALAHSEDFFISLAETFPAVSAMMLLVPLFLYVVSLVLRSRYLNFAVGPHQFQVSQ